ncbi:hypothetical protein ACFY0G_32435 [Streptomyces sp. NPDC001552]|uniref:hypothetical protein n=1 Tax=Streptomyces sp. NPDC001552 TaxID=3364587 RepID=UPI0036C08DA4
MDCNDSSQYKPYGPGRFAPHLPFASRGYLFTLPGSFPEDVPAALNVTDWTMAVYRTHSRARGDWEVRDVNGDRRVWGTGPTRRVAAGLACQEIARRRRTRAADIARERTTVLGLEAVPPYAVETTGALTLVLAPQAIGRLVGIDPGDIGQPATYEVSAPDTGRFTVQAGSDVDLHPVQVGVFHHRCGCEPADAARFETEEAAVAYAAQALTVCWPCRKATC